jgi:serine/threonine protein kinase
VIRDYIGKYRIEERVGSGTFATVYRCFDPDLDAICAVKVLSEQWSEDESARNWFLNEARIMFEIAHPSILRVFTTGQLDDERPYIVMEYADQGSLADLIRERRLQGETFSVAEALEVSIAIADGLTVAHDRELVHRDLKPSNILFRTTNTNEAAERREPVQRQVKIADFGLARGLEQGANSLAGAGTPHYIAPEQARALPEDRPDVRNDVYSAAAMLYEMLTGQVPFPYRTMSQVIAAHLNEEPQPLRALAPHVPNDVASIVQGALTKDLEKRTSNAFIWRDQLKVLRTAINPDGTISDWTPASEKESLEADRGHVAIPVSIPGFHASTAPAVEEPQVLNVDDDIHESEPSGKPINPMVPYVAVAVVAGILIVAMIGVALAGIIDAEDGQFSDDSESVAGVVEQSDGADTAEPTVEPTATTEPAGGDQDDDPTPTPESEPTPTIEPTETPTEEEPADERIAAALQALPGDASSAVILSTGSVVEDRASRQVPAASTIKLWIAAATYDAAADGNLDLDAIHAISTEDQAFGTGILNQDQFIGQQFSYRELIEIMLVHSDNSAANVLTAQIGGFDQVNAYAGDNGYSDTRMQRSLGDLDPERENYTSARDGARFMERLLADDVVNPEVSEELRSIIESRSERDDAHTHYFSQELPSGAPHAHVSGLLPNVRNEIGYFYQSEQDEFVVVSFMLGSLENEGEGEQAIASAVRDIHGYLSEVALE